MGGFNQCASPNSSINNFRSYFVNKWVFTKLFLNVFLELLHFRNADKRITDCCLEQSGGGGSSVAKSCPIFFSLMNCSTQAPLFSTISQSLLRFYPSSLWCYLTDSSPAVPFLCPQSFPASESFPMSRLFTSGGQRIGASASASVLPVNIQGWFPSELTGLISLLSRDFQVSSPTLQFKSMNSLMLSLLYGPTLTSLHDY